MLNTEGPQSGLTEIPDGLCDNCMAKATRWFNGTMVKLCSRPECLDKTQRSWNNSTDGRG